MPWHEPLAKLEAREAQLEAELRARLAAREAKEEELKKLLYKRTSRKMSVLISLAQSFLIALVLVGVFFLFQGSLTQVQQQRSYALGVTCSVVSADNSAIVGAIASSHGYYSDPVLSAFLRNRQIAPILRANHFPTEQQEIAYAKVAAKAFGAKVTDAVVRSVGQRGRKFVSKNGMINCSALKKAVVGS